MVAAIYLRQSLDREGVGAAVGRQLDECRALALAQGLEVSDSDIYSDNDVSASTGIRPAFTELVARIKADEIDTVICWHTDRLYRRVRDLVDLVDLAETRRLSIVSVRSGSLDLSTPSGRMLAGMLGHAARYEVEQKSIRQAAGFVQRARRGYMTSARVLYGYVRDGKSMRIDPEQAKVVRSIFAKYISGWGTVRIANWLNQNGVLTSYGRGWNSQTIRVLMGNRRLIGLSSYKGTVVGVGNWPSIITKSQYARYLAVKEAKPARVARANDTVRFLSGVALCGTCGRAMGIRTSVHLRASRVESYDVYRCLKDEHISFKADKVEAIVEEAIISRLTHASSSIFDFTSASVRFLLEAISVLRDRQKDLEREETEKLLPSKIAEKRGEMLTEQINELQNDMSEQLSGILLLQSLRDKDVSVRWFEVFTTQEKQRVTVALLDLVILTGRRGGIPNPPEQIFIRWKDDTRGD